MPLVVVVVAVAVGVGVAVAAAAAAAAASAAHTVSSLAYNLIFFWNRNRDLLICSQNADP